VVLVKAHIARVFGFEIAGQMLYAGLLNDALEKCAADAVALLVWLGTQYPEIPVCAGGRLIMYFVSIVGGVQKAPQTCRTKPPWYVTHANQCQATNGETGLTRWETTGNASQIWCGINNAVTQAIAEHDAKKGWEQTRSPASIGGKIDHQRIILKGSAK